ncbi:hypothetical protein [Prauserella rugosa]|uniref:Uncharacterized protein n=1 Tax=Prauserella rugosa TaxID=43354 RepID=A0A660CJ96_9PSEU|nr:hypothetical protein [Prauserella rugosa]TWH21181.1 hypothetical protein JD82_03036 [Prauserella rugosa]
MASGDGTQAFESAPTYGDSLTGSDSTYGGDTAASGAQTPPTSPVSPPAQPTAPDLESLRSKVAAALAEEEAAANRQQGEAPAEQDDGTGDVPETPAASQPTEEIEQERRGRILSRMRGQLMPGMLRRRQKPTVAKPLNERLTVRKPSNASTGLFVALVLLVVFVIVAIQFVVSFVESIAGLFS